MNVFNIQCIINTCVIHVSSLSNSSACCKLLLLYFHVYQWGRRLNTCIIYHNLCFKNVSTHALKCIKLLLYWDWQAIDTDFYGIHVIHDFMFCFSLYAYNHACLFCSAAIYCWLSMYCLYIVILLCFKMQIFSNQQEKTKCQSWFK